MRKLIFLSLLLQYRHPSTPRTHTALSRHCFLAAWRFGLSICGNFKIVLSSDSSLIPKVDSTEERRLQAVGTAQDVMQCINRMFVYTNILFDTHITYPKRSASKADSTNTVLPYRCHMCWVEYHVPLTVLGMFPAWDPTSWFMQRAIVFVECNKNGGEKMKKKKKLNVISQDVNFRYLQQYSALYFRKGMSIRCVDDLMEKKTKLTKKILNSFFFVRKESCSTDPPMRDRIHPSVLALECTGIFSQSDRISFMKSDTVKGSWSCVIKVRERNRASTLPKLARSRKKTSTKANARKKDSHLVERHRFKLKKTKSKKDIEFPACVLYRPSQYTLSPMLLYSISIPCKDSRLTPA